MAPPHRLGRYALLQQLGRGSAGVVYRARRDGDDLDIALKCFNPRATDDIELERFRHEARVAAQLDSPYLARLVEADTIDGTPFIAMAYIEGYTLGQVARAVRSGAVRLSVADLVQIGCDVLAGLDDLHGAVDRASGAALDFVHRDIKPTNLIVDDRGTTRVIDLGIGVSSIQRHHTVTGMIVGTPGYLAPEQANGGVVDARTDLYAAALVLYELATGTPYLDPKRNVIDQLQCAADPPKKHLASTRPDLEVIAAVLERALEPVPADRYPSAAAFSAALRAAVPDRDAANLAEKLGDIDLDGEAAAAITEAASDRIAGTNDTRGSRTFAAVGAVTLLVIAFIIGRQTRPEAPPGVVDETRPEAPSSVDASVVLAPPFRDAGVLEDAGSKDAGAAPAAPRDAGPLDTGVRAPTTRRRPRRRKVEPPEPPPAPPATTPASVAYVEDLERRVRALRGTRGVDVARLKRLTVELMLERRATPGPITGSLRDIDRRVRQMERAAQSSPGSRE
ncbi:MAG: serine/threonine-protein kinase [Deltaproteobacteria bacterium]